FCGGRAPLGPGVGRNFHYALADSRGRRRRSFPTTSEKNENGRNTIVFRLERLDIERASRPPSDNNSPITTRRFDSPFSCTIDSRESAKMPKTKAVTKKKSQLCRLSV